MMVLRLTRALTPMFQRPPQAAEPTIPPVDVGTPIPDFTAYTLDGQAIDYSSFAGKPLALIFMSTNCPHCRSAIPELAITGYKARHRDVQIVPVVTADLLETQQFIGDVEMHLSILAAPPAMSPWLGALNPEGIVPAYCYVDSDGIVQSMGGLHSQEWRDLIVTWQAIPVGQKPVALYR